NAARLWGGANRSPYPKDGINDHVVSGAATVNPDGRGTKGALHYVLTVAPGESAEVRLRLRAEGSDIAAPADAEVAASAAAAVAAVPEADLGDGFAAVLTARQA